MSAALLPRPRSVVWGEGHLTWTSPLRVAVDPEFAGVVDTFTADLEAAVGWEVTLGDADAALEVRRVEGLAPEAYRLRVGERALIEASDAAGARHALTTLRQLGSDDLWSVERRALARWEVPRVEVDDAPAFAWRGVHLDVSRHFFDVATVTRLIDLLAAHRLNHLHLHLNDDQGWRVEVPGWERLTEVGAWRASSPLGHERDGRDDAVAHGGFYRAADLVAIGEHAAARGVTIVPEIDLPGHAQAVIAAYPELGNGDEVAVWTRWGISEHVLNVSPAALDFATEVVGYVASLFPDSPVHIGGDECPTSEWAASAAARAVMAEHGFRDPRQLQGLFTTRLAAALAARGHEVVAWDEVLDASVPPGTIIAAWRGVDKGLEAARRGFDVVMAPMQYLYLDWPNSSSIDEPVAQTPPSMPTTWEKVYSFTVVPAELEPEHRHRIRGTQAQLWTEYIATRDHLDYMGFPRLSAFAEVAWGTATSAGDVRPRLVAHLGRLRARGVAFRPLDPD